MTVLCMAGLDREIKALKRRLERASLEPDERERIDARVKELRERLDQMIRNFGGRAMSVGESKVPTTKRKGSK